MRFINILNNRWGIKLEVLTIDFDPIIDIPYFNKIIYLIYVHYFVRYKVQTQL